MIEDTTHIQHYSYSAIITAEENSNHGKHHGNSSQDQQITEDFPLWWPPEESKGMQNTTSSEGKLLKHFSQS